MATLYELSTQANDLVAQPPKIDKTAIKKDIKDGKDVPGATIIINEGVRIR